MVQPPAFFSLFAVYIDANIATRRDRQVSKEACHAILGVLEDGSREVSSVVNHPGKGAVCWKEEFEALEEQGVVAQIDLVVSDALQGTGNAVCAAFPRPPISCLKRQILNCVSHKDKPQLDEPIPQGFICYLSFTGQ